MSTKYLTQISKRMSYLLRHKPEDAHLHMDEHGWVSMDEFVKNTHINRETVEKVVATSDKQRYSISDDGKKIRANQGHSFHVELDLEPVKPPAILYHGTATRFIPSIDKEGIKSMDRDYVHMTADYGKAITVGKRHGTPVVYNIPAEEMYNDGINFYHTVNDVWLTKYVDPKYLVG